MEYVLKYLEIAIIESCNLNCKGCSHFSPLAGSQDRESAEEFRKDLERIHELFPKIYKIRILGGEPLLHPEWTEILRIARQIYPYSEIHVVSNGLKIPHLTDVEFAAMREKKAVFDISLYKPTLNIKSTIEATLNEQQISYEFTPYVARFRKRLDITGSQDPVEAYRNCVVGHRCTYLYKGKLSGCPAPNVVRLFDRHFGTQLSIPTDMINIHETTLSVDEIYRKITSVLEVCKYCGEVEEFDWAPGKGSSPMADWIL